MRCNNCGNLVSYQKAPTLKDCIICGTALTPEVRDILEFGKYNITEEKRPSQLALATDVEKLLLETQRGTLLAEGGTGIGKSFAYLIPTLLAKNKRAVISTAKKTLQDQLFIKDIPYLKEKMGKNDLVFSLYKGKSNYACWRLASEVPREDKKKYQLFVDAARNKNKPADVSEWPETATPSWWYKISIDNCVLGTSCPHYKHCRPQPRQSNIVVTNHHLTAIDIRKTPGMLFGEYNLLILDEAHQASESFRSAHSKSVTERGLDILEGMVLNDTLVSSAIDDSGIIATKHLVEKIRGIKKCYQELYTAAKRHTDETGTVKIEVIGDPFIRFRSETQDLGASLFQIQETLSRMRIHSASDSESPPSDEILAMLGRIQRVQRRTENLADFVTDALDLITASDGTTKPSFITTVEENGLTTKPLNIGPLIGPKLKEIPHKIFMSATLAMGTDFTYSKNHFGLPAQGTPDDPIIEKIYKSPFDLQRQAVMYLPMHIPIPAYTNSVERPAWISAISTEIAQLVGATHGGAFVLFSAKADMVEVMDELQGTWDHLGLHLVVQEGEATAAREEFLAHDNSVLFGLKSFWEGVDVAGDQLRLVIIPKLPFPNPKDPIIAALVKEAGNKWFNEVMVPQMIFDMKQGVGRLIRTQSDRGFVAILDPRVWTGSRSKHASNLQKVKNDPLKKRLGFGKLLLDTLGYTQVTDDFTVLQSFVKKYFNAV